MYLLLVLLAATSEALELERLAKPTPPSGEEAAAAAEFVSRAESELLAGREELVFAEWDYDSNITDHNEKIKLETKKRYDGLKLRLGQEARRVLDEAGDEIHNRQQDLRRKLQMLANVGTAALPDHKRDRIDFLTNEMAKIYSKAKVPSYTDPKDLKSLNPDLTLILADSRDPEELDYYWTQFRAATGGKMRKMYQEYVELTNEAARLNGFRDGTEMKVEAYESSTFVEEMDQTWRGLKPLYEQLHAYVRNKLSQRYGPEVISSEGPIPAHLLGNMWAQSWKSLEDLLRPYQAKPTISVTKEMEKQGWTPKFMFEKADEFFQSMGLDPMSKEFWKDSIIEKPKDGRDLSCHASAWDFFNGKDFRIKQCTIVTERDFIIVNHEMGHIQYYMSYHNQSYLFRKGANPGFHEGVADIASLAVSTPAYYQRLGLLDKSVDVTDYETNINILMNTALLNVAILPFAYTVDKYRWDLYSEQVQEEDINCHWVKLRLDIQGVSPPSQRTESDFDPGAKFHVAADIGYIRYFTAFIYEVDFFRSLCLAADQYDPDDPSRPLHRCDLFGQKKAGRKLLSMLELGASKPWKEVIKVMTGKPEMSTDALREYFKPLEDWLREENSRNGVAVGWKVPDYGKYCRRDT